jgi:hypothetical protein
MTSKLVTRLSRDLKGHIESREDEEEERKNPGGDAEILPRWGLASRKR